MLKLEGPVVSDDFNFISDHESIFDDIILKASNQTSTNKDASRDVSTVASPRSIPLSFSDCPPTEWDTVNAFLCV
jgi:hypothetical protein